MAAFGRCRRIFLTEVAEHQTWRCGRLQQSGRTDARAPSGRSGAARPTGARQPSALSGAARWRAAFGKPRLLPETFAGARVLLPVSPPPSPLSPAPPVTPALGKLRLFPETESVRQFGKLRTGSEEGFPPRREALGTLRSLSAAARPQVRALSAWPGETSAAIGCEAAALCYEGAPGPRSTRPRCSGTGAFTLPKNLPRAPLPALRPPATSQAPGVAGRGSAAAPHEVA